MSQTSTPLLSEFRPVIPFQRQVINDVRVNFDYSRGVYECLLSGAIGSSKSVLMAHLAVTHCLLFPGARVLYGRRALPDLKDTLIQKTYEHIDGDLVEGKDYKYNETSGEFSFRNGSQIISRSWADKHYRKLRSLELSAACIEELTENGSEEFLDFYKELRARVGRLKIPESWIMAATNPDSPAHAAYDHFIKDTVESKGKHTSRWLKNNTRYTYYSVTSDNPFLHPEYINQIKETLTAIECRRMLYGEWIEIKGEVVYYAFSEEKNVIDSYDVDPHLPVLFSWDFNIGEGKPMSAIFGQYDGHAYHAFDEIVIHTARTLDVLEEAVERGLLNLQSRYRIQGDATGSNRTTNYHKTDYQVISEFLSAGGYQFEMDVPLSNPPVRKRHIICNGALENAKGESRVKFVRSKCKEAIKGLKLVKLKQGGQYVEDDSPSYQHVTTAWGYSLLRELREKPKSETIPL